MLLPPGGTTANPVLAVQVAHPLIRIAAADAGPCCDRRRDRRPPLRLRLEYDRGTMGRRDLDHNRSAYAASWDSKEWIADSYAALPRFLFIVPETTQERRVREACVEARLRVLVTTAAHLQAATLSGPIWRQILPIVPEGEQAARRALWE